MLREFRVFRASLPSFRNTISLSSRSAGFQLSAFSAICLSALSFQLSAFSAVTTLPPPASRPVTFSKDIKPILSRSCLNCHGKGRVKGGFRVDDREALLSGGHSGPAILPGKSDESLLIKLVAGLDPDSIMPQKGSRLTAEQIGLLRAWIDQGAKWEEGFSFAKGESRNLKPRKPQLTLVDGQHPVDALLPASPSTLSSSQVLQPSTFNTQPREQRASGPSTLNPQPSTPSTTPSLHPSIPPGRARSPSGPLNLPLNPQPSTIPDSAFARRVHLDIIGLLPEPAELREFEADSRPDKRAQLVQRLLANDKAYAEHWLNFWNDLLRNDYKGAGFIDSGRKQISTWLYQSLLTNKPYHQLVAELVNPGTNSEGFVKGIVWRGVVNASQTPAMQAAQNISQVFMGVNLKCASCHDSFIDDWRLSDAYGLAAIYHEGPLELFECDKPTGQQAEMRFLYPELGSIDPQASKEARLERLAQLVTGPQNGRLPRTLVNRLWAKFFGFGLVEPVDDMEQPSWNPDLLDWLAEDLVAHGYDVKHTIEVLLTSRAYQMPAVDLGEAPPKPYVFKGPAIRRLAAEQFRDAVGQLTGVFFEKPSFEAPTTTPSPHHSITPGRADSPSGPVHSPLNHQPSTINLGTRSSLVPADPLMTALGRPSREQVVTVRPSAATTLQALELTNGKTLANVLHAGADRLATEARNGEPRPEQSLTHVYELALGRTPTQTEAQLAMELLGDPTRPEGWEDLLWAITMLPEFQLIQ